MRPHPRGYHHVDSSGYPGLEITQFLVLLNTQDNKVQLTRAFGDILTDEADRRRAKALVS